MNLSQCNAGFAKRQNEEENYISSLKQELLVISLESFILIYTKNSLNRKIKERVEKDHVRLKPQGEKSATNVVVLFVSIY